MAEDHTPSPLWEPYLRPGLKMARRDGGDASSAMPILDEGCSRPHVVSPGGSEPVGSPNPPKKLSDISLEPAQRAIEATFRATHERAHVVPRRFSGGAIQDSLYGDPPSGGASRPATAPTLGEVSLELTGSQPAPALPLRVKDAWPDAQAPAPLEAWLAWLRQKTGVDYTHEVRDPHRLCQLIRDRLPTPRIEWVRLRNGRVAVRVGKFTCEIPASALRQAS